MKKMLVGALFALALAMGVAVSPAMARDGKVTWKGDVYGTVEIAFRGRSVNYRRTSGKRPENVKVNFDSSIPDRSRDVSLDQKRGRGSVSIVQRPDRNNNYTTVVRIEDNRDGHDYYIFELRWNDDDNGNGNGGGHGGGNGGGGWPGNGGGWPGNGGGNGGGSAGNNEIRWSGRVDGTQDIRIQRNRVTWYKVDGGGARDVNYRVGDPLPYSDVRINVNKRRGRGGAYVLLQPSRQNNYTATIRITDKDAGDDFYDLSIRW